MFVQYLINVKPLFVAYSPRPDEVMLVRYVQPLTDEQRGLLEKAMKEDTAFRARSRAHSLWLSAGGTPIQTIAKTYQVYRVTVSAWIKKWQAPEETGGYPIPGAQSTPYEVPHPALQGATAEELARGGARSTAPPLCRSRHRHGWSSQWRAGAALVSREESRLVCGAGRPPDAGDQHPTGSSP